MALPISNIGPAIKVGEDFVTIDGLTVQNLNLAQHLRELSIEEQVHFLIKILNFGTETYELFMTTAAAEALKKVSIEISTEVGSKKDEIVAGITDIATRLTSAEGDISLKKLLENWRQEFSAYLTDNFDANNKESILNKFDELMAVKAREQNEAVLNRLDFNLQDSAVNSLKEKIEKVVKDSFESVGKELSAIKETLAGQEGADKEKRLQSNRGKIFEKVIFDMTQEIAQTKGDIADDPGPSNTGGLLGNNEGDVTVEINESETKCKSLLFVIECKLRKASISDRKLLEELDKGIANRGARAGIIIKELDARLSPDSPNVFQEHSKGRAILQMNPEDPDIYALKLAYLWARWQCLRDSAMALDSEAVGSAVRSIKLEIDKITTAKSNNTHARGYLEANDTLLEGLRGAVKSELARLEELMSSDELNDEYR